MQSRIASRLQESGKRQLLEAQRAWERYRDAECRYRQANFPSMTSNADCQKALASQRARDLSTQLEWLDEVEGNIGGGPASCESVAGKTAAARLVRMCLAVTTATRPPCNAQNSCELITSEIKRSCRLLGKGAPSFCRDYR
ncbi:hypothetical protein LCM4573_22805 [Rhizobium sp. LCM 4573]|nr:hypothetical protein LCM4573_22805 [Rhizobium sp. LCM 4573]